MTTGYKEEIDIELDINEKSQKLVLNFTFDGHEDYIMNYFITKYNKSITPFVHTDPLEFGLYECSKNAGCDSMEKEYNLRKMFEVQLNFDEGRNHCFEREHLDQWAEELESLAKYLRNFKLIEE